MNYFVNRNIGEVTRYNHEECGDKRQRLYVTREQRGWKFHCHNCAPKFSGFHYDKSLPDPLETVEIVRRIGEQQISQIKNTIDLPEDMCYELPDAALAWLYKYGIRDDEIELHRIGWSDNLRRLILPVVDNQTRRLTYWQGRSFTKGQPKYVNTSLRSANPLFVCGSNPPVVFVEDILSAIKVGRVAIGIALLGSYFKREALKYVDNKSYIWLDNDKRMACIKLCSDLSTLQGFPVKGIYTERDPKEYSEEEIRKLIH